MTIVRLLERPEWQEQAKCRGMGTELFFSGEWWAQERAKQICVECPVRCQCLDFALEMNEDHGTWGGESERGRRRLLRKRRLKRKEAG